MARRRWNIETIEQVVNGESPFIKVGYTPKPKKRKLGDRWKDHNGITWEQCNGYKKRVNVQADSIRDMLKRICSKCGKNLDFSLSRLDDKVFPKTGKCFDCLQAEESILRMTGEYEKYEQLKMTQNKLSYLRDFRQNLIESIAYLSNPDSKISFVSSDGSLETWSGEQNAGLLENAKADLDEVDKLIGQVERMVTELS